MITNMKKETTCKKYFDIIEMIYEIGNGLFFRKDLFHFCNKFYGYKKSKFIEAITDLQEAEIIDFIKIGRVTLIRLRKYALRYLTGKGRTSNSSITITGLKLAKLNYYIAIVWKLYKNQDLTFVQLIKDLNKYSNFFLKEKEGHLMLEKFKYLIDVENIANHNYKNVGENNSLIEQDINALFKNYYNSFKNLGKIKTAKFELADNEATIVAEFNANNILKLNYLCYDMEDVFIIYVIDYRNNIFLDKYLLFIQEAYRYFSGRFKKPIKFVTVSNDGDNMFVADNDVLVGYLSSQSLWGEYNNNMSFDTMYVDTMLKMNIDFTTIKKDTVLEKI
ncbi:hypothetical protein [Clostridium sp.]